MNLSELIKEAAVEYPKERKKGNFTGNKVREKFKKIKKILEGLEETKDLKTDMGIGQFGQFAYIPWIAIKNPIISQSTKKGIYIVLLFSANGNNVYLTLNQGADYLEKITKSKEERKEISRFLYETLESPKSKNIDIDLELGENTNSGGKEYEFTTISGFKYDSENIPDISSLKKDLQVLIDDYEQLISMFINSEQGIEEFYENILIQLKQKEEEYIQFKELLQAFVFQSEQNIKDKERRTPYLNPDMLKNSQVKEKSMYNSININDKEFHVHLFSNASYGREKGFGGKKVPYICYQYSDKKWANIRTTFENYKMITMKITLWDELNKKEEEVGKEYEITKMALFSESSPSNYLRDFYNEYVDIRLKETNLMKKKKILDLSQKLLNSKNIILRGSPGTGKSYLSKEIASELIGISIEELEYSDQFEFVQFHPSYDYTDFVEGIRPTISQSGEMGFELKYGIFKEFCKKAMYSFNNSEDKRFVFIIDEINRGEISKIFGELFFSIDPSYRGKKGSVKTQYNNMENFEDKFYIPENVYIIGTMNDIDRSIDTFDFAMRRRFRFIKIEANENTQMLEVLGDKKNKAIERMVRINEAISSVEELNSNYHIGAAYFLKLRSMTFDELWKDYLQPLLADYIRGMFNEEDIMNKFESAYYSNSSELGENNEEG